MTTPKNEVRHVARFETGTPYMALSTVRVETEDGVLLTTIVCNSTGKNLTTSTVFISNSDGSIHMRAAGASTD